MDETQMYNIKLTDEEFVILIMEYTYTGILCSHKMSWTSSYLIQDNEQYFAKKKINDRGRENLE